MLCSVDAPPQELAPWHSCHPHLWCVRDTAPPCVGHGLCHHRHRGRRHCHRFRSHMVTPAYAAKQHQRRTSGRGNAACNVCMCVGVRVLVLQLVVRGSSQSCAVSWAVVVRRTVAAKLGLDSERAVAAAASSMQAHRATGSTLDAGSSVGSPGGYSMYGMAVAAANVDVGADAEPVASSVA